MRFKKVLFPGLREILLENIQHFKKIYLVGGAVRDAVLGLENIDLDFVVLSGAIEAAKLVANYYQGDCFVMDEARQTTRAILEIDEKQIRVDFAVIRGDTIEADLHARDFSINAMAVELNDLTSLIDPLNGYSDLGQKILRPCREDSFINDPIRTLRAVRFIQNYHLKYDKRTAGLIKKSSKEILSMSAERVRDELFNIFEKTNIKTSLLLMQEFSLFDKIFPELIPLENFPPEKPHEHDGLRHTFRVVELSQLIYFSLVADQFPDQNGSIKTIMHELEQYKDSLRLFVKCQLNPHRTFLGLMILAALYHDSGKVQIPLDQSAEHEFNLDHADISAKIFLQESHKFALSNSEREFTYQIIKHHMNKCLKTTAQVDNSKIEIYKFFRDTGSAGVLIVLLHLADLIATYEQNLTEERWQIALHSASRLLNGWFNLQHFAINPPKLIDGDDLIKTFDLLPGKQIGSLLEKIREEQVLGNVTDRETAIGLVERIFAGNENGRDIKL